MSKINPFTADEIKERALRTGCAEPPRSAFIKAVMADGGPPKAEQPITMKGWYEGSGVAQVMPSNPKQAYGDTKVPLHLFPTTAIAGGAMAFLEGMGKYGQDNYRAAPVEAMTYVRACDSHMKAWQEGEEIDTDSGLSHLFKALACIAILIDSEAAGSMIDNRKFPGGYHALVKSLESDVARLRAAHADKNPKHYSIKDAAA